MLTLDGNQNTVEEALDRMQYYQHSRRSMPDRHKTVRELTEETTWPEGVDTDRKYSDEIESRISRRSEESRKPPHPLPEGGPRESLCYRCGEKGHFRRTCPLKNRRRSGGGECRAERRHLSNRGYGDLSNRQPFRISGDPSFHPRYWLYLQPMVSLYWILTHLQKP